MAGGSGKKSHVAAKPFSSCLSVISSEDKAPADRGSESSVKQETRPEKSQGFFHFMETRMESSGEFKWIS